MTHVSRARAEHKEKQQIALKLPVHDLYFRAQVRGIPATDNLIPMAKVVPSIMKPKILTARVTPIRAANPSEKYGHSQVRGPDGKISGPGLLN